MTIIPAIARVARSLRRLALAATPLMAALSFAPGCAHADPAGRPAPCSPTQGVAQPAPAASTAPAGTDDRPGVNDSAGAVPFGPGWG